jgi:hypothetical protein
VASVTGPSRVLPRTVTPRSRPESPGPTADQPPSGQEGGLFRTCRRHLKNTRGGQPTATGLAGELYPQGSFCAFLFGCKPAGEGLAVLAVEGTTPSVAAVVHSPPPLCPAHTQHWPRAPTGGVASSTHTTRVFPPAPACLPFSTQLVCLLPPLPHFPSNGSTHPRFLLSIPVAHSPTHSSHGRLHA